MATHRFWQQGCQNACNFIKKRLQRRCFFAKFLRIPFLKNIYQRLPPIQFRLILKFLMTSWCKDYLTFLKRHNFVLTLIWVGILGVRFEVGMGENYLALSPPPPSYLKLFRIILETWNLVRKYTHTCSFRKYVFWCRHFFQKISNFGKNGSFTQSNSVRALLEIF